MRDGAATPPLLAALPLQAYCDSAASPRCVAASVHQRLSGWRSLRAATGARAHDPIHQREMAATHVGAVIARPRRRSSARSSGRPSSQARVWWRWTRSALRDSSRPWGQRLESVVRRTRRAVIRWSLSQVDARRDESHPHPDQEFVALLQARMPQQPSRVLRRVRPSAFRADAHSSISGRSQSLTRP